MVNDGPWQQVLAWQSHGYTWPCSVAGADVTLPRVFGNHMVLQQQMTLPVWGWADPGEAVTVTLGDHSVSGQADDQGRWMVSPARTAGRRAARNGR